jgi:hypothetical protein
MNREPQPPWWIHFVNAFGEIAGFWLTGILKITRYWMVKQQPETYSWDDLVRDGKSEWTGVRNYELAITFAT